MYVTLAANDSCLNEILLNCFHLPLKITNIEGETFHKYYMLHFLPYKNTIDYINFNDQSK